MFNYWKFSAQNVPAKQWGNFLAFGHQLEFEYRCQCNTPCRSLEKSRRREKQIRKIVLYAQKEKNKLNVKNTLNVHADNICNAAPKI